MDLEKVAVAIRNGEICCHEVLIGAGSHGFIYKSRKGRVHIFADKDIGLECQQETFFHEVHHAYKDMRTNGFIIGIDDWHNDRENQADNFAKIVKQGGMRT